jgi:hypothetical protein
VNDESAFMLLGLEPTLSEQAVHEAFRRAEAVFRPGRFVGDPPEVRALVERLRQQSVNAYAYLCARQRELRSGAPPTGVKRDAWDVARKYREQMAQRHTDALEQEARHARWAVLEQEAKERARREAEMAGMLGTPSEKADQANERPIVQDTPSLLEIRLGEARAALHARREETHRGSDTRG